VWAVDMGIHDPATLVVPGGGWQSLSPPTHRSPERESAPIRNLTSTSEQPDELARAISLNPR
jgi:hypothetical protein